MGGSSSTTTQQSTTQPWAVAQPMLNQLLGNLSPLISNSGLTGDQTSAINQLTAMGQAGNPYAGGTQSAVNSMLAGGGSMAQAPAVQAAYNNYQAQTSPLASNTNYNPMNTPGFSDALNTLNQQITNQVNSEFAAAGRSGSGMNTQTLAQGLAQGEGQLIANQYNQNVQNQQAAASNLYGAGNTTANTLAGYTQQGVSNQNAGVNDVGTALNASTWGPNTVLQAQNYLQQIPAENLGLLAQIGIPIAGLGTQSNGTSTTQNQMSGAQEFATILGGIGSLIPKGPMNFNF